MADYISALNGQQMDAALTEVALYNPEAWAVGTRNGVNVTSADETWHNNAKYYAQVAQSAIPGTYTAAVRWDIAQGLAGEAQEQARANISAGASNRNLLDNPFFQVNQRNFTSNTATNNVWTVDRWKINNGGGTGGTVEVTGEGYIKIVTGSAYTSYQQAFGSNELAGKTVTLTVNDSGLLYSVSADIPARTTSTQTPIDFVYATEKRVRLYVQPTSAAAGYMVQFSFSSGGVTAVLRAVKLELGSYSTLANDVPPDYGEELRKCQYYFRRITVQDNGFIALGWATSATAAQFPNILGTSPMRAKPTATPTGAVYVRDPSGTDHAVSSFTVQYDPVTVCLQANTSGLTANTVARLRIGAGGRIDLSADL